MKEWYVNYVRMRWDCIEAKDKHAARRIAKERLESDEEIGIIIDVVDEKIKDDEEQVVCLSFNCVFSR